MTVPNKVGVTGIALSCAVATAVLSFPDNGRLAQGGVFLEFIAFLMFLYAGIRGARKWFIAPMLVVAFWIAAAHIDLLWTSPTNASSS